MPPTGKRSAAGDPATRAIDALERGAVVGMRVARSLYGRWRRMSAGARAPLAPLAADVRERALDLRGESDLAAADRGLRDASERLADALLDSAATDPDVSEIEVRDLRAELAEELDRLARADIRASRGTGSVTGEAASAEGSS